MFSSSEKATHTKPSVHKNNGGPAFFRKAEEQSFFGSKESASFFNTNIQPKLTVSSPDDPQEKEADAMAEHVMRMSEPTAITQHKEEEVQTKPEASSVIISDNTSSNILQASANKEDEKIQTKCDACEQQEKKITGKSLCNFRK